MQISGCRNRLFLHLGSWIYVWSQCAINLQHDKCYSPFCSLLSLYKWKSVILLKVIALRMGYSVYFRLYIYIFFFNKRCRANMTKYRPQNTKIRPIGIDPIYSWYLVNFSVNTRLFKNDVYEFRKDIIFFFKFIIFIEG